MANRYWVGGTGTWSSSSTTNWSTTSGGSGGASAPTASDDVFFDASSGGGTCSLVGTVSQVLCKSFNATGYTGTITASSFCYITVKDGNVALGSGVTYGSNVAINHTTNVAGSYTANLNGKPPYYSFYGTNVASITVSGATNCANGLSVQNASTATFTDSNISCPNNSFGCNSCGTVNLGSGTVTCRYIYIIQNTSVSGSRTVTLNGSGIGVITNFQSGSYVSSVNVTGGTSADFNSFTGTHPTTSVSNCSGLIYTASSMGSLSISSGTGINVDGTVGYLSITAGCPTVNLYGNTVTSMETGSSVTEIIVNSNTTVSSLTVLGPAGTTSIRSNSSGTQKTLTSYSYSLSNITWKDIDAAGNIPFTGTGFVDGGNNLDIQFPSSGNGLFFGSNF